MATQVLNELVTTHHLKLTNTTETPHYFRLLVSRPFSVSHDGASCSHGAGPGPEQECEGSAAGGKQLVLHPQDNMLVSGGLCGPHPGWALSPGPATFLSHRHTCV